jgi:phosphatidylserine decarboxylase
MSEPKPLPIWDRQRQTLFEEFSPDHPSTYETHPRRSFYQWLESHPLYDWLVAAYQNTRRSARQIDPFIREHNIHMAEFKPVIYRSFAEFFDREFVPGKRTFPTASNDMGGFAEARYFGWERIDADQRFPIKGHSLEVERILGSKARAARFEGGPVLLARLSPVDYHHLHYPDDGTTLEKDRLGGRLWTVNWHALQNQPEILFRNERQVNILQTKHFGLLGFVEVGALSVGRIVQMHPYDQPYSRGAEKSVFRFGGSAVVVFGEPAAWRPSDDILKHTKKNIETLVRLGQPIAKASG